MAVVDGEGNFVAATKMPAEEQRILEFLDGHSLGMSDTHAVLELVRSSPQMGVVSAFTFGRGYGGLRMALTAMCVDYTEVTPQKWQKFMGCRTGGDKNVSKDKAIELFPKVKVTHAIADALLLAEYARRQREG